MLDHFGDIKDMILKLDPIWIDNNVFRLHYKATVIIFAIASLLVTSHQYIGDPIDCISDDIPSNIIDTYCWIHSTFSIPSRWDGKTSEDFPYPGIGSHSDLKDGEEPKYHKYYQWVCFFLFLQCGLFYIPRYLWKTMEGGKIVLLIQELTEPIMDSNTKTEQINRIVRYMTLHRGSHDMYAIKYFLCELLNFINCIAQIYFIDFFLDYEFTQYGSDVINFSEMEPEDRVDPMVKIFPKLTKCTFHKYGPSGSVEKRDSLCVLPVNIINEKIFIFLWFWLICLAAITGVFLIYRLAVLMGPQIRVLLIKSKGGKSLKRSDVESILEPPSMTYLEKIGDWLVLYFICKNLDTLTVNQLMKLLYQAEAANNSNTETLKLEPQHSSSV